MEWDINLCASHLPPGTMLGGWSGGGPEAGSTLGRTGVWNGRTRAGGSPAIGPAAPGGLPVRPGLSLQVRRKLPKHGEVLQTDGHLPDRRTDSQINSDGEVSSGYKSCPKQRKFGVLVYFPLKTHGHLFLLLLFKEKLLKNLVRTIKMILGH